jgi:hypothetical protein
VPTTPSTEQAQDLAQEMVIDVGVKNTWVENTVRMAARATVANRGGAEASEKARETEDSRIGIAETVRPL